MIFLAVSAVSSLIVFTSLGKSKSAPTRQEKGGYLSYTERVADAVTIQIASGMEEETRKQWLAISLEKSRQD